jgi:hypothetical protein
MDKLPKIIVKHVAIRQGDATVWLNHFDVTSSPLTSLRSSTLRPFALSCNRSPGAKVISLHWQTDTLSKCLNGIETWRASAATSKCVSEIYFSRADSPESTGRAFRSDTNRSSSNIVLPPI